MLKMKSAVTTDVGTALLAKQISGVEIEFTKLATGSGKYSTEESTKEYMRAMTALKEQKQTFGISSIETVDKTTVTASSMISNAGLSEAYTIREVGLFACEKGKPDTEVLCSICIAEIEDFMPAYSEGAESRILENYSISVSDSDTVFLSYVQDPVALVSDVDRKDKILETKIDESMTYAKSVASKVQYDLAEVIFQLSIRDMTDSSKFANVIVDNIDSASAVNLASGSYSSGKVYI